MSRACHKSDHGVRLGDIVARIMERSAWCNYEWTAEMLAERLDALQDKIHYELVQLHRQGKVKRIKQGGRDPSIFVWVKE